MPYIRVWVHFVWSTKNRIPYLSDPIRPIIFDHIRENAAKKNIFLDEVNGYVDHVHCLVSLKQTQTIAQVAKLLKGESSRWINQNQLCSTRMSWQKEYYVVSVGERGIKRLRKYIRNQEAHHRRQSFDREIQELEEKHGLVQFIEPH